MSYNWVFIKDGNCLNCVFLFLLLKVIFIKMIEAYIFVCLKCCPTSYYRKQPPELHCEGGCSWGFHGICMGASVLRSLLSRGDSSAGVILWILRSFWGAFFTGHLLATASVLLGYYPNNSDLVELVYIVLQSLKPKLFKVFLMYFSWKWKFIYLIESVLYPRLNLFVLLLIYNQSDFCDQWFSVLLDSYIQRRYLEFFLTIHCVKSFPIRSFF